ncbi:MAG: glycosyltransferase family 2 protein [Candidatus Micrarchaeia archaeon]
MAFVAAVFLISMFISNQVVFIAYTVLSIYVFSIYLFLWKDGASHEKEVPEPKEYPSVTVAIPSYNAKGTIFECIAACRRMKYPGKFDILVIDDGSTDGSYELLEKTEGITLLRNRKNCGKAAAINFATKHASGEILACVDSDSYPREDALQKAAKHFCEDRLVSAVVVFICVHNPKTLLERIQEIEYWLSFGFFFKTVASIDALYVIPGPTALYRKSTLMSIGGFDEHNLTEDMEIALRMQKLGYKIRACHESVVYTDVPATFWKLLRQRLRWYRGGVMNVLKYNDLFFNPKYGDFGVFILPTTLGSGFFAALFMAWMLITTSRNVFDWLSPFLANFSAGASATASWLLSGAMVVQSVWVLGVFSLALWGYFLIKSFEISNSKPKMKHIVPLICLLWLFPFFVGFTFLVSYIYELFGVKYSW